MLFPMTIYDAAAIAIAIELADQLRSFTPVELIIIIICATIMGIKWRLADAAVASSCKIIIIIMIVFAISIIAHDMVNNNRARNNKNGRVNWRVM